MAESILQRLPLKLIELCNVDITICRDEKTWYLDFNTGMKSHLHLYFINGNYIAKGRYGMEQEIETFEDFHTMLVRCECSKGFMMDSWIDIFKEGFGEFSWDRIDGGANA